MIFCLVELKSRHVRMLACNGDGPLLVETAYPTGFDRPRDVGDLKQRNWGTEGCGVHLHRSNAVKAISTIGLRANDHRDHPTPRKVSRGDEP